MAYLLANLEDDLKNYTEVGSNVFTSAVMNKFITNAEMRIYRAFDADLERFYATSNCVIGNRYVTIPQDLRVIRYVQLKDDDGNQTFLEQRDPSFMQNIMLHPGLLQLVYLNIMGIGMKNIG